MLDLIAQVAHPADDRFVHAADAVEVFGAIDQVVVAVGADDDAEHVGGSGLIDRDQALAQGNQRPFQARPHHREAFLGDVQLADRLVEFGLLGVEPRSRPPPPVAQRGDLAGQALSIRSP